MGQIFITAMWYSTLPSNTQSFTIETICTLQNNLKTAWYALRVLQKPYAFAYNKVIFARTKIIY